MLSVTQSADAFRRALLAHDSVAERQLLDAYAQVWAAIRASLDALLAEMAEAEAAGQTVGVGWLYRSARYQALLQQVEREIGNLAYSFNGSLARRLPYIAFMGAQNAQGLIRDSLQAGIATSFIRLPIGPIEYLAGAAFDPGSPLSDLLMRLPADAVLGVKKALIVGVATGQNPRMIARLVRDQAGITLTRALTISRSETLRAYRDAALDTYRANGDVVQGWVWHSALGTRTCPFCWAQHGSFHPLSEMFASHPNCRCAPIPATRSYAELGINAPDTRQPVPLGADLFDDLDPAQQRRILGPGAYQLYADGDIALADMASFGHSKDWGPYGYVTSLYRLKRRAAA